MDVQQSRRIVLVSVLAMLLINTFRGRLSTSDVTVSKRLWGTGMVAIMLGFLADVAPTIAGPLAALSALGLASRSGDAAFSNLLGAAGTRSPSAPRTTPGGTTAGGSATPSRPAAPVGFTPVGGTR